MLIDLSVVGLIVGFLGNPVVNNTGLNLQATGNIPVLTSPSIDTIGVPSECLLLKNMFDPENEVVKLLSYTLRFLCHTFSVVACSVVACSVIGC